jgi:hypothetical protein
MSLQASIAPIPSPLPAAPTPATVEIHKQFSNPEILGFKQDMNHIHEQSCRTG